MPRRAQGPRLLYREREGRWYIRDGSKEQSTGCSEGERRGAESALQAYLAAKHEPDFGKGDPARVLVTDVLMLYIKERDPANGSPERGALPDLNEFWAGKMVSAITPDTCRAYSRWRMEQPNRSFADPKAARRVSRAAPRRELEVLAAALNHAHAEHKLLYPVKVTKPEQPRPRDRWMTRDEAAKMLWAARKLGHRHVARFLLVGLYTGTRHRAILALRWIPSISAGWVDLEHRIVYRRGSREDQTRKRRTPVPISNRLLGHLRRWKRDSATHVVEYQGEALGRLRGAWNSVRIEAGLTPDVTPHVLRHTFATWAVQGGTSIAQVAGALGTTSDVVQATYGHHSPESLRGVVDTVARRRK